MNVTVGHELVHRRMLHWIAQSSISGDESSYISHPLLLCNFTNTHHCCTRFPRSPNYEERYGPKYDTVYSSVKECKLACDHEVLGCDAINFFTGFVFSQGNGMIPFEIVKRRFLLWHAINNGRQVDVNAFC